MSGRQNTAGFSHEPAEMWSFTEDFSLARIIFFIFKLITDSEGTSLPVLTNPAVMMLAVMCKSDVVKVIEEASGNWSELGDQCGPQVVEQDKKWLAFYNNVLFTC